MGAASAGASWSRVATRRQLLGGAGLVLLTTACGSSSGGRAEPRSDGAGFPVTVSHKYGSAEIPAPPRRVVTVGLTEQDYVLALGLAPVGVREWFGGYPGALWPWARKRLGGAALPTVLPQQELDFEQVAALNPDVILGINSGLTSDEYDKLSQIAPTVAQPGKYADYSAPWQEITRLVGRALGRPKRAAALIPDIEKRFERARVHHPGLQDGTGLLATSIGGKAYIYAEGPAPRFLRSLGLKLPAAAASLFSGEDRAPVQVSLERLDVLGSADVLVFEVYGDKASSVVHRRIYQALGVARQGRGVILPEMSLVNGALSFASVLSLPLALDRLVPRLATAIDRDPATEVSPVPTPTHT